MLCGAYEPVFNNLKGILEKRLSYGRDVVRDTKEVVIGMDSIERFFLEPLIEVLHTLNFHKVLDLGCGNANILSQICKLNDDIQGIGIDLSKEACEEANIKIQQAELEERVKIFQMDATDFDELQPNILNGVDLVISMFLMHEILKQKSREGTINFLKKIASTLEKDGMFLMIEVLKRKDVDLRDKLLFIPEYELIHDFSNQKLATYEEWMSILDESGIEIIDTRPLGICQAIGFIGKRKGAKMLCRDKIKNYICMDIIEKASLMEKEGKNIIHFEKGELDFQTPEIITQSAIKALNDGKTKYTVSTGLQELKEAICEYYLKKYSVSIDPSQVIINAGSSPALLVLFLSMFSPKDEIILTDPCYSGYPKYVEISGAKPIYVDIEKNGFEFKVEDIKKAITDKTGAIIINSPSNPVGSIIKENDLRELSKLNKLIISDEVYHRLNYSEERDHSILEFTDYAIVVNSFSKLFGMSGWRLGYIIVPKAFIDKIKPMQQNFFVSPNSFVQWAGITALKEDIYEINNVKNRLKERKEYLEKELIKLGFEVPYSPKGVFYIFANAKKFCLDSVKFEYELLENINVAVAPGVDFGSRGERYLRFSYTTSMENIEEGIERLNKYLKEYSQKMEPLMREEKISILPKKTCATENAINALRGHIERRKDVLTSLEQEIRKYILTYFFDNFRFPTVKDIQSDFNLDTETVLTIFKKLDEFDAIRLNNDKNTIKTSYPFSSIKTDYKVFKLDNIDNHFWYATCPVDALGIAYMFGIDIKIESISAFHENEIGIVVKSGKIIHVSPSKTLVFCGTTYCSKAITSMCGSMLFFSSESEYEEWREANIKVNGEKLSLEEALYVSKITFQYRLNDNEIVYENTNTNVKQCRSKCVHS